MRPRLGIPNPRVYFGAAHYHFWCKHLEDPTFVYVIRGGLDKPIKIGVARDVYARIGILQTGNPYPLRLLYLMPGSHKLEHMLHRRLKGNRTCGEWFAGEALEEFLPEVAELSERMVKAYDGGEEPPEVQRTKTDWLVGDEIPKPEAEPVSPIDWERRQGFTSDPVPPDVAMARLRAAYVGPR